jgi:FkbM family methyltransferase
MPEIELPDTPRWIWAASRVIRSLPAGRYRAMNWVARRGGSPFWTPMPDDLGGLVFRCDLRDVLMREVCITGRYEPQETVILQNLLRAGMTFVDVGANWGYFTLAAAYLVGARGHVVSVEADPRASATLNANVAKNRLPWVRVVAAAASDSDEMLSLRSYGPESDGSANFGVALADALTEGGVRFEVRARPLDAILDEAGAGTINVLKMDIEGAEGRALTGLGKRLAAGAIDRIILELHPWHLRSHGTSAGAIVGALQSHGYDAWQIDHSPAIHRKAAATVVSANSLLTPLAGTNGLNDAASWPHLLFARRGLAPLLEEPSRQDRRKLSRSGA